MSWLAVCARRRYVVRRFHYFVARPVENKKIPIYRGVSGRQGCRDASWPSVWPFGCIADVQGLGGCWFVARVHENEKNPVKFGLQGVIMPRGYYVLPRVPFNRFIASGEAPEKGWCGRREYLARLSQKVKISQRKGGPRPPRVLT